MRSYSASGKINPDRSEEFTRFARIQGGLRLPSHCRSRWIIVLEEPSGWYDSGRRKTRRNRTKGGSRRRAFMQKCLKLSSRQINLAIWALAGVLSGAAAIALVLGTAMSLEDGGWPEPRDASGAGRPNSDALPSVASMEPIWNLRLRPELAKSPAAAESAPVAAAQPLTSSGNLPVTLVGTVGESLAMLQGAGGDIEVCAVGETIDGIEILQVRPARVEIRYNGRVITLEKPPEAQGGP